MNISFKFCVEVVDKLFEAGKRFVKMYFTLVKGKWDPCEGLMMLCVGSKGLLGK